MRITFVLPKDLGVPIGGYKVAYDYADGLALLGNRVSVVHPWTDGVLQPRGWGGFTRALVQSKWGHHPLASWYSFRSNVRICVVPWLSTAWMPAADATVLTAWQTADALKSNRRLGRLFHLVYDFEFFAGGDEALRREIRHAMRRPDVTHVATSRAVAGMLTELGVPADATVTAGLDTERFRVIVPPRRREPSLGFALRDEPHKGIADLLEALQEVHAFHPGTKIRCFGRGTTPLPSWIESHGQLKTESLPEFYNRCSVFVLPSHYEGWGLPAAEAMACGAALITTASGGVEDFAEDELTALLVRPAQPAALSTAISRVLDDDLLRLRLARAGAERGRSMRREASTRALASVISPVL